MIWKCNWESKCGKKPVKNLDSVDQEKFEDLIWYKSCKDAPVPAEKLVEYVVESQRRELLSMLTIERVLIMLYNPVNKETGMLTGADYLRADRMHCAPELRQLFRKIIALKDQLAQENYDNLYLYDTAVFEICRRNDSEMLKIYLDELKGYCPEGLYDAVFDYYIYMYLPEWDLLKRYNDNRGSTGVFPGCCSTYSNIVSSQCQQEMLDILIQQSEKCGIPRPEALQILFDHQFPSCRCAFPIREQCVHFGTELSNRDVYNTSYAERILFHYDDKELAPDNCIDPWDFNDLLTDSCCAVPVTCTCGDEGCGGITAVSESWVIGNKVRLYIPERPRMYFFEIPDRTAMKKELLMMLEQALGNVRKLKKYLEKSNPERNKEDDPILPYGTTSSYWRKLCKEILKSLPEADKKQKENIPMAEKIRYRTAILDEYGCPRSISQCGKCSLLINGTSKFICEKYLKKLPAEFWNNEEKCPDCTPAKP